uniref:Uncharacterized protein n=2 Tax=Anabas testudineus TaxID=64144 RepID=A0AAQ6IJ35_ANATE
MSHNASLLQHSSSVVDVSPHRMVLLLLLLLLILPLSNLVMTSSLSPVVHHSDRVSANKVCHHLEMPDGGMTVRCSGQRLTQVPVGLSNLTIHLHLDKNLLRYLPADSFSNLFLLTELDLSHNQLSLLEAGCFRGLASSLHFLDLSSNRLSTLDPAVLGDLGVLANLSHN